jgi:DNA-binding GntR family transcriptional regulator
MMQPVKPLISRKSESKSAPGAAYAYLKDQILTGELPGGTSISPNEVGKLLGISRMPVREALLQLEGDGLIQFGLNRRPIVTTLTPTEIMETFEIRIALEQLAMARSVHRLTDHDLASLSMCLARMNRAKANPRAWLDLHDEFHDRIYSAAGMTKLIEEIARVRVSIRPYLLMYISFFKQPEIPGSEHFVLIDVIRQRDASAAQIAIANHIRAGASNLVYFLLNNQAPPCVLVDPATM